MANLEGNDIDDLFKRASDKYPLRTDSADWDKLAAALEKDPSLIVPPPATEGGRRRRRGFFWLFLLLPLGGIGYYVWQTAGHPALRTTASSKIESSLQAPAPAQASSSSPVSTQTGGGSTAVTPENAGTITPAQSGTVPAGSAQPGSAQPGSAAEGSAQGVSSLASARPATASNRPAARHQGEAVRQINASSGKFGSSTPAGPRKTKLSGKALHNPGTDLSDEAVASVISPDEKDANTAGKDKTKQGKIDLADKDRTKQGTISLTEGGSRENDPAFSNLNWQRARIPKDVALNVTVKATNTTIAAKDSSSAKSVSKKNKNKKESSFYAGLLVAPDLSTIKFQSVKGVGTTYGILLGYNISNKWAIETGAYLDHKKYYTDGEYFKKAGTNYNNLQSVTGSCNMVEIPVNVRYNFNQGTKMRWFATAGFSTYLMSSENYISKVNYNGSVGDYPWSVNKPSQYWFSVFNLSVGFEQRLGKIGNLRLEPYLRIPLAGMGSGSLPIMSAGLNIGITRKLW